MSSAVRFKDSNWRGYGYKANIINARLLFCTSKSKYRGCGRGEWVNGEQCVKVPR